MQSKNKTITDAEFIAACQSSKSMFEASKKLGLAFTTFRRRAVKLNCYKTNQAGIGIDKKTRSDKQLTEDILAGLYPNFNTYRLKIRLLDEGYKHDGCEICGWCQKPEGARYSPCELHHKDGNPHNHRLENLVLLCPNCHSLTNNYRARKKGS